MKKNILFLMLVGGLIGSTAVLAATNPSGPGESSQGTMQIMMPVGAIVKVSGVSDVDIASWTGQQLSATNDPRLKQNLCIYSNNVGYSGKYQIQITDVNAGGAFHLSDPRYPNSTVKYALTFSSPKDSVSTTFTSATTLSNLSGATTPDCRDQNFSNASLDVTIYGNPTIQMGNYTDTINVTVSGNA